MKQNDWTPDDIERIANMTGLPPQIHAWHQRDWTEQRNRQHEDMDEWGKGYRAFFEGKPQSGRPEHSAWARGWEYARLDDDD